MSVPITGVAGMLRRALNTLDQRLMNHGERVGYLVWQLLTATGGQNPTRLREGCYLALFHDIGAYKTEQIAAMIDPDELFSFEVSNSLSHSIYSYLFLRDFSALRGQSDAVLFHHFAYPKLLLTDCQNKELAAKLFLSDRVDIILKRRLAANAEELFALLDNPVFCPNEVAALRGLERSRGVISKLMDGSYMAELETLFDTENDDEAQTSSLVRMLPYTIDFRSEYTVTHTVVTVEITLALAELLKLPESECEKLHFGALLHDVGKISISLMILEKQTGLTAQEFIAMKEHVVLSEMILQGGVSDEVLKIAVRHHEKLDGSGYPHGLTGAELTQSERIVAVADIMSALMGRRSYKEPFTEPQVRVLMEQMAANCKLCPKIIRLAMDNYGMIAKRVEQCSQTAMARYRRLNTEFDALTEQYRGQV